MPTTKERLERSRLRRRVGRAGVPVRSREADRRVQPAGREPEQPSGARRREHQHELAADPDADPDRRGSRRLAARPDHPGALRRAAGARRARLLVEHPAGRADPRVDSDLRPARRARTPARRTTTAGFRLMDDTGLSHGTHVVSALDHVNDFDHVNDAGYVDNRRALPWRGVVRRVRQRPARRAVRARRTGALREPIVVQQVFVSAPVGPGRQERGLLVVWG